MADLLKKAFELLVGDDNTSLTMPALKLPKKTRPLRKLSQRELIQLESEIGATLFGPVPKGHHRQFFNLDRTTWIWYEEWIDHLGKKKSTTTRYEIHDQGILKVQEGARYNFIEGQEFDNFVMSTRMYYEKVARELYKRDPQTGQSLV
ncbi:MAG: hypothetical protein EOO17_01125 [Chloroflexi bacterium]|nr:MAG: hypothetical protein EOO17_01125 [Chloroflexota bacterium]